MPLPQYKIITYEPPTKLPKGASYADHLAKFLNDNVEPAYRIAETLTLANMYRFILELRD